MQRNYTEIFRWMMVIPAAVVGWLFAIMVGIALISLADSFCPPELMESVRCRAPWYESVESGIMIFSAALSAVLTLVFSVLAAPRMRDLGARLVFLGGAIYATYFAYSISAWLEYAGVILFGLITMVILVKKYGGRVNA